MEKTYKDFIIIIDINGVFVKRIMKTDMPSKPQEIQDLEDMSDELGVFRIWRRPDTSEFLIWLLDTFTVGVWSSAQPNNVELLVDYLFGKRADEVKLRYSQYQCTKIGKKADGTGDICTKPLADFWKFHQDFTENNTIIVDDSLDKVAMNPLKTYIVAEKWDLVDKSSFNDMYLMDILKQEIMNLVKLKQIIQ